ncbi:VanZ family protein [Roseivirga sp.]|uniref:VanZ family protein n=1 Tax=Roseivirga sp. TaxID=1964215 RepID=UPI002B27A374|nr:VanZ family protein [Roseivirga sp.]
MPSFIKQYWASLSWAIVLAVLMLLPQDSFPESKLLSYDKIAHLGVFGILSFLVLLGKRNNKNKVRLENKYLLSSLTICVVYGLVLELLQSVVPGRMTDIYDLLANTIGAIVGVVVFSTFMRY